MNHIKRAHGIKKIKDGCIEEAVKLAQNVNQRTILLTCILSIPPIFRKKQHCEVIANALAQTDILAFTPTVILMEIAKHVTLITLEPGKVLLFQGNSLLCRELRQILDELTDSAYTVLKGSLDVVIKKGDSFEILNDHYLRNPREYVVYHPGLKCNAMIGRKVAAVGEGQTLGEAALSTDCLDFEYDVDSEDSSDDEVSSDSSDEGGDVLARERKRKAHAQKLLNQYKKMSGVKSRVRAASIVAELHSKVESVANCV